MRRWRIEINNHDKDEYSTPISVSCRIPNDYIKKLEQISKANGDDLALTFTKCLFFGVSDYVTKYERLLTYGRTESGSEEGIQEVSPDDQNHAD